MQTHVVPVGFDYDRLIAPLVREQLAVDKLGTDGKRYVDRKEHEKSYRTRLSRIGELWGQSYRVRA